MGNREDTALASGPLTDRVSGSQKTDGNCLQVSVPLSPELEWRTGTGDLIDFIMEAPSQCLAPGTF